MGFSIRQLYVIFKFLGKMAFFKKISLLLLSAFVVDYAYDLFIYF